MEIKIKLNGRMVSDRVEADTLLIDFLRDHGCASVKRGCETANCGLCTVLMDGSPILSCSTLAARADGHAVTTLEGLQEEAADFVGFIACFISAISFSFVVILTASNYLDLRFLAASDFFLRATLGFS